MKNALKIAVILALAGLFVAGNASEQGISSGAQQSAAKDQSSSPSKPVAPGTPASKPGQADSSANSSNELKTDRDRASYALGMNIGEGLKKQSEDLDPAIVQRAMQDALSGNKMLMTEEEAKSAWMTFQVNMRKKQEVQMQQQAETNKKEGETFLAENKAKEGVVTLPSGLQYKILTPGTGPKPTANDQVVCNYKGTLINGTEFDSSAKHGGPATFPVTGVIKGWTEALQLMPVGSKWELFVPSDLAYGARGAGGGIAPNSTLIFEVELVSIKSAAAQPGAPAPGGSSGAEIPKGDTAIPAQNQSKAQPK